MDNSTTSTPLNPNSISLIGADSNCKKLSFKEKLIYASGNLPGNFFGSFTGQIQTFFVWWMGLGAIYILIGQILYGIWNMVNDPLFATLQDRTKTKDGRYIPWIKWFAPLFTVAFILLFVPPMTWRTKISGDEYQIPLFIWYIISLALYDTFFTIVYLAHVAILPQMTMNEKERTDISIYTTVLGLIGTAISGILPFALLVQMTNESIALFQKLVILFGILGMIPWILIVKYIKEKQEYIPEKETPFIQSLKYVFTNPSGRIYVIYDGISVGINNTLMTAITFIFGWIFGINTYYQQLYPDWGYLSIIPYLIPIVAGFLIGLVIELKIPKKWDVKTALMYSMICEAVGFFIAYISIVTSKNMSPDTYILPGNLWGVSIGMGIVGLGFTGDFIYHNVMRADTIDYDEYLTGERRESIYAGIGCLLSKPMNSVVLATIPLIILSYGLEAATQNSPSDSTYNITQGFANAVLGVGTAAFLFPCILAVIGIIFWLFYPLNRKKLQEMRLVLDKMHEKKRSERLCEDGSSKFVSK
jgi:GPH family glycoside/pentoside/hexuronide:cation symporter